MYFIYLKSGRINEESIKILKEAGIEFNNGLNKLYRKHIWESNKIGLNIYCIGIIPRAIGLIYNGKLKWEAINFPLEVFFLRGDDIPQYIEDGVADIGIVGKKYCDRKK